MKKCALATRACISENMGNFQEEEEKIHAPRADEFRGFIAERRHFERITPGRYLISRQFPCKKATGALREQSSSIYGKIRAARPALCFSVCVNLHAISGASKGITFSISRLSTRLCVCRRIKHANFADTRREWKEIITRGFEGPPQPTDQPATDIHQGVRTFA